MAAIAKGEPPGWQVGLVAPPAQASSAGPTKTLPPLGNGGRKGSAGLLHNWLAHLELATHECLVGAHFTWGQDFGLHCAPSFSLPPLLPARLVPGMATTRLISGTCHDSQGPDPGRISRLEGKPSNPVSLLYVIRFPLSLFREFHAMPKSGRKYRDLLSSGDMPENGRCLVRFAKTPDAKATLPEPRGGMGALDDGRRRAWE